MDLKEAQRALNIARDNLRFAKAPRAQQRVIIAKDVIAALRAGTIVAESMEYMDDVQMDEGGVITSCTACALGSVFACATRRGVNGHLMGGALAKQATMHRRLSPYFDEGQLRLIESAFECGDFSNEGLAGKNRRGKWARAIKFGNQYPKVDFFYGDESGEARARANDKKRMTAIMRNIIENEGTFRP